MYAVPHAFELQLKATFPQAIVLWENWPEHDCVVWPMEGEAWLRVAEKDGRASRLPYNAMHIAQREMDYDNPIEVKVAKTSRTGGLTRKRGNVYDAKFKNLVTMIPFEKHTTGRFIAAQLLKGTDKSERIFDICGPLGEYQEPDHRVLAALRLRHDLTWRQFKEGQERMREYRKAQARASWAPLLEGLLPDYLNGRAGRYQFAYNHPAHPNTMVQHEG